MSTIEERRAALQAELAQLDAEEANAAAPASSVSEALKSATEAVELPVPAGAWQEPTSDVTTGPPPSTPTDAVAIAQEEHPEKTISQTSLEVVAEDGSTARNSPGYSELPCPVCHNTSLKTVNVQSATPIATLRGDTVNPGDQVVVCETCSTTISKGDIDQFAEEARGGAYGPGLQSTLEQQSPTFELDAERKSIEEQRARLESEAQALFDREEKLAAAEAAQTEEGGGAGGNSKTEGGGA